MEELLLQVLERFTDRLAARQRAMYEADVPFLEKWRTAMRFARAGRVGRTPEGVVGAPGDGLEPPRDARPARARRRGLAHPAADPFRDRVDEYGIDFPLEATVALVVAFNKGIQIEQLSGISTGHRELLGWIDAWLEEKAA